MVEIDAGPEVGAASEVRGALPAGGRLGSYQLISVLGQGGFAITYRARDATLGRDVAIKEYLPSALALREGEATVVPRSTEFAEEFVYGRERFLDEARTLARFGRVPAIGQVHGFFEANGTAYMVMELAEGETLERRLKRERTLPRPAVEAMLGPLLDGLEEIHARGFLHRDIKPANVVLDPRGKPTLIDFGASRAAMAGRTAVMTAIFTPGYAAAEQFGSGRQGPWTDIYGLAATLHHAVAGTAPPSAIERAMGDTYQPLTQRRPAGYPPELLAGIDAGLAVQATQRPQSIADWRAILGEAAMPGTPARIRPRSIAAATPERRGGRPWLVAALAATAVLAGGGYYLAMHPSGPDPAALETARQRQQAAEAEAARRKAVDEELAQLRAREASRKAEEEVRQKAQAEAAQRQQIEVEARRRIEAEVAARRQAEEEARRKAEDEAKARQAADEGMRLTAEAIETNLRLSLLDRQHIQVALTALGYNTNGSDGAFGPHTRRVITAWQKSRGYSSTGYLDGTQNQELLKTAAAAIAKFDDDQKKADEAKKKADEEKAKAEAAAKAGPTSAPAAAPPAASAAPAVPASDPTKFDIKKANLILRTGVDQICGGPRHYYNLNVYPDRVAFHFSDGWHEVKVQPDGSFDGSFKHRNGTTFKLAGNTKTRDVTVDIPSLGCVFHGSID